MDSENLILKLSELTIDMIQEGLIIEMPETFHALDEALRIASWEVAESLKNKKKGGN